MNYTTSVLTRGAKENLTVQTIVFRLCIQTKKTTRERHRRGKEGGSKPTTRDIFGSAVAKNARRISPRSGAAWRGGESRGRNAAFRLRTALLRSRRFNEGHSWVIDRTSRANELSVAPASETSRFLCLFSSLLRLPEISMTNSPGRRPATPPRVPPRAGAVNLKPAHGETGITISTFNQPRRRVAPRR